MHAISWYSFLFYIPGLTSLIQRDELILEFARGLLYKIKDEEDRRNSDMRMIRTKVRMLGRMVAEVQGRTSPGSSSAQCWTRLEKQLTYFVKEVAQLKVGHVTRLDNRLGEEMVHEAEKFLNFMMPHGAGRFSDGRTERSRSAALHSRRSCLSQRMSTTYLYG